MKTPQEVLGQVILGTIVVVIGLAALYVFGGKVVDTVQAPAKLEAAIGVNAALAKGAAAQNQGTDSLALEAKKREAKSRAAVDAAGKGEFKAADNLRAAPKAPGATAAERAANRINADLGL